MPSRCYIRSCRGNKKPGPKVKCFGFPKNAELLEKWHQALQLKVLTHSVHSKICELHFKPEDIITETSQVDSKGNVISVPLQNHRLAPDAVPCIFEDLPAVKPHKIAKNSTLKENQDKTAIESSVITSTKSAKNLASPLRKFHSPGSKLDGQHKKISKSPNELSIDQSIGSPKKSASKSDQSLKKMSTTYRPTIAVIKAEDLITDEEKSPEKMNEDIECIEEQSPSSKPFTLPSPFKNLPNVSVCLKEEDRVSFPRDYKKVKRSPSTGSSSSSGSADTQKSSASLIKRRKIEKPAPVVIGRQNDCYCWVCHRENVTLLCMGCPRAFHTKCAGEMSTPTKEWVCPECQHSLAAENVDTQSSTMSQISLDRLAGLLKLSLNKMRGRAPIAFHQPVSLEHYPLYLHYVIHPMDFSLLEKNIKQKLYGCTEAFLADVKWISHNSCVFNGTQHPLSTNAKNLVKSCDQDMQEIEVCPDCFVHSINRNKYWFSEVCRKPHPLVWAKLKGFPYWPAKVVRIVDGNVDARFFGAHDRAWVPVSQCYHLSKEMPTTSKPKKKGNYEVALDELNVHVQLLIQKFGCFEYAPYRTAFNTHDKYLMYHGIDIDKASQEDISTDNSTSQSDINFLDLEKRSRFASFMESESEKSNIGETKLDESQSSGQTNIALKLSERMKSPDFHLQERQSTDSITSEKETIVNDTCESNKQKATVEEKTTDVKSSSNKEAEQISDSDQLRKLELALERIKGYVNLSDDAEKESSEEQKEEDNEKNVEEKTDNATELKQDITDNIKMTSLLKKTVSLPVVEASTTQETVEDVSVALEAAKKSDSFFLKLNETIESCKAKLGISEIDDNLSSDDSVGDENGSKSDEDEEESSGSESEEEASDDEENAEASDEEIQNVVEADKNEDSIDSSDESTSSSDDESSDSDDESNGQSSGTDIEGPNEALQKKTEKLTLQNNSESNLKGQNIENEISVTGKVGVQNVINDSNEAVIMNPDVEMPEVTIDDSGALEIVGENNSSENSNELISKENSESAFNETSSERQSPETVRSPKIISTASLSKSPSNIPSEGANDLGSNVDSGICNRAVNFSSHEKHNVYTNDKKLLSPEKISPSLKGNASETSSHFNPIENNTLSTPIKHSDCVSPRPSKNQTEEEEDDDIFICTPTRPKSPPVIVLDDDQENEASLPSDTYAVKSPPYSTSVESINNEEVSPARSTGGDDFSSRKIAYRLNSQEQLLVDRKLQLNEKPSCADSDEDRSLSELQKRKRKFSSDDESSNSESEIQIVKHGKRPALTGAIRTFNKPNGPSLKPKSPTVETVRRNLAKESLNQMHRSSLPSESSDAEASSVSQDRITLKRNVENLLKAPNIDTSNMSEKDKEILFLRRKMNCIMTAYKIQSWKCNQEREELRHNMNLIIMEMRASLESDKKQAVEKIVRKLELEKQKAIEETKRKQWCATCLTESRYACCWNTSYCSIECQKKHFPEHRNSCTQVKARNLEVLTTKQKPLGSVSTDSNENKKVFIVNMKHPDNTQQAVKSQIVLPPKNTLQISGSTASSNNIQFVLKAPVKPPTEPTVIPPSTSGANSKESNLDSAEIIHQVRNKACNLDTAIHLLRKKNKETTLLMNKKKATEQTDKSKEETDLEEIYFPSPPKITFEGYDTAVPEPNLVMLVEKDLANAGSDEEAEEYPKFVDPEPDLVVSDADDLDNELVSIGYGVSVKAKVLNKCLACGKTPKKLTRCLVDIIFPDNKLLASCSAFGMKSNVTKLTRAALPTRKVQAIIDYVQKRFPEASRSEIVLAVNMKCKEARFLLARKLNEGPRKRRTKRSLPGETQNESHNLNATETSTSTSKNTPENSSAPTANYSDTATTSSNTTSGPLTTNTNTASSLPTSNSGATVETPITNSSPTAGPPSTNSNTTAGLPTTTFNTSGPLNTTAIAAASTTLKISSTVPSSSSTVFLATTNSKMSPNVVCVQNPNKRILPKPIAPGPNILRCSSQIRPKMPSQILVKPKHTLQTVGNAAILQTPSNKPPTVKDLLANRMNVSLGNLGNLSKDGTKLLMTVDTRPSTANIQSVSAANTSTTNNRPYFILNTVRPPSSTQHSPSLPVSSQIKK